MGIGNSYASQIVLAKNLASNLTHVCAMEIRVWTVVVVGYQKPLIYVTDENVHRNSSEANIRHKVFSEN